MTPDETAELSVTNDGERSVLVEIEPWGDEYPLPPGERLTIRLCGRGVSLALAETSVAVGHAIRVIEGRWLSGPGGEGFPDLQVFNAAGKALRDR